MQKSEHYKVISTKISPDGYIKLCRLAGKAKMKPYEILQMCADTLIRYMDDKNNLTPEMEKIMSVFEDMVGWKDALNLADPFTKLYISDATYYLKAKGRTGTRAIHVERPFFGDFRQTSNVTEIFDRTVEVLAPMLYRRMRMLCAEKDCKSTLELLQVLVSDQVIEDINHDEIRKQFEDCNRADNSKPIEYRARTKKGRHYDTETMPNLLSDLKDSDSCTEKNTSDS